MVERDRREDRDLPVGDVGRVPLAAHADLDDRDIHRGVGEARERQHGECLEVGELGFAGRGELGVDDADERDDVVPVRNQRAIGDRLAVDHDALVDPLQVRTRHEARAQPVGAQDALGDTARRGLAVGAGDVDDGVRALRVAEHLHGTAGGLEARLRRALADAGEQVGVDAVGVGLILGVLELPVGVVIEVGTLVAVATLAEVGKRAQVGERVALLVVEAVVVLLADDLVVIAGVVRGVVAVVRHWLLPPSRGR